MAGIVRSFWEGRDETANCYENRTINGDRSLGLERQKRAKSAEPGLTLPRLPANLRPCCHGLNLTPGAEIGRFNAISGQDPIRSALLIAAILWQPLDLTHLEDGQGSQAGRTIRQS